MGADRWYGETGRSTFLHKLAWLARYQGEGRAARPGWRKKGGKTRRRADLPQSDSEQRGKMKMRADQGRGRLLYLRAADERLLGTAIKQMREVDAKVQLPVLLWAATSCMVVLPWGRA